jgi:hypothetical protein
VHGYFPLFLAVLPATKCCNQQLFSKIREKNYQSIDRHDLTKKNDDDEKQTVRL